ncbi:MAG: molecular chaperone HtpG [Alphaproteobacteria bacterium]
MSDAAETMEFQAEVGRLLRLMAHSVYSEKEIFLRELISNASDACDKLRYLALAEPGLLGGDSDFAVHVRIDKPNRRLVVSDNGIGMDRDDLVRYLGSIAKSGAADFLEMLEASGAKDAHVIGQFGIGFYSTFMVADTVEVLTRKAGEEHAWLWRSDGEGAYTVEPSEKAKRGTDVILNLKEGEDEFLEAYRLRSIIKAYSDHIPIPVHLSEAEGEAGEQANSGRALWTLPRAEATAEQHKEFYAHVGGMGDGPWRTIHWKAEGTLEYAGLLYLPSSRPFNLFNPVRKSRVKLYVRRVFITDEAEELLPGYLRFLVGVIDSEDLPLNVSREMLQNNAVLRQIRSGVVRRVLREIDEAAKEDAEGYAKFWEDFGVVLKEGVYEDMANRDALLKLCRFRSTAGDGLVSLEEYVGRMKPGQEAIYYITGDADRNLAKSPQIEGFAARGVEVLLLTDPVDDFWPGVVGEFDGKPIRSATQGDADLDKIEGGETAETEADGEAIQPLIAAFKQALGAAVKDVRASKRLTESPVCLVAEEGDMDLHLARMLKQHGEAVPAAARILELNPGHPLVRALNESVKNEDATAEAGDFAHVLLDHARIAAGELPDDPALYSRRVADLLTRGL